MASVPIAFLPELAREGAQHRLSSSFIKPSYCVAKYARHDIDDRENLRLKQKRSRIAGLASASCNGQKDSILRWVTDTMFWIEIYSFHLLKLLPELGLGHPVKPPPTRMVLGKLFLQVGCEDCILAFRWSCSALLTFCGC